MLLGRCLPRVLGTKIDAQSITRTETSPELLENLLEQNRKFKEELYSRSIYCTNKDSSALPALGRQYPYGTTHRCSKFDRKGGTKHDDQLTVDSGRISEAKNRSGTDIEFMVTDSVSELDDYEKEMEDLVNKMEIYLQPISHQLTRFLQQINSRCSIYLLADFDLLELPLEALNVLNSVYVSSVSRDFSLQMLYQRLEQHLKEDMEKEKQETGKKKGEKKEKPEKDKKKHPKESDDYKYVSVDIRHFTYILDPNCDIPKISASYPPKVLQTILKAFPVDMTCEWSGRLKEPSATLGEFESGLTKCNGFIFYGTENFLSYLEASKLVSLFTKCHLMLLFHDLHTEESVARHKTINSLKSDKLISLQHSITSMLLMSMCGTSSLISLHYPLNISEVAENFRQLLIGLLEKKKVGEIMHKLYYPHWHSESMELLMAAQQFSPKSAKEEKKKASKKEKEKKGKKSDKKKSTMLSPLPSTTETINHKCQRINLSIVTYGIQNLKIHSEK